MEPTVLVSFPLSGFFDSAIGFSMIMIAIVAMAGVASKSLSVAAVGSYTAFVYFAANSDIPLFTPLMYLSLIVITTGIGFKFWRLEAGGEGGV